MDAAALRDRLEGVELAVLFATEFEAAPFVERMRDVGRFSVATKRWLVGRVPRDRQGVDTAVVVTGVDKTNTAHALTCLLQAWAPRLVLQAGVGGAYEGSGLVVGDLALASAEVYADSGASTPGGWIGVRALRLSLAQIGGIEYGNRFDLDPGMVGGAVRAVQAAEWGAPPPAVRAGLCLTSSTVTGRGDEAAALAARWDRPLIESMEGAAAAHVCALYGVPFLEVRGVSNIVADRDRSTWNLDLAAARAARAALAVAGRLDEVLVATRGGTGPGPDEVEA